MVAVLRDVPWICGDTTYYWKNTYATQYDTVYGGYKTGRVRRLFVLHDGPVTVSIPPLTRRQKIRIFRHQDITVRHRERMETRYHQTARHISVHGRAGALFRDRLATAILNAAGRTSAFISGKAPEIKPSPGGNPPSGPSCRYVRSHNLPAAGSRRGCCAGLEHLEVG